MLGFNEAVAVAMTIFGDFSDSSYQKLKRIGYT